MTQEENIETTWHGPQFPDYFEGRDGGVTQLGAFWRHSDQLKSLSVDLKMARHRFNFALEEKTSDLPNIRFMPSLGPLSYVARGLVFLSHDHPSLSALGTGAITDGNLVLIHRGLLEALNIASYKDASGCDHLLAFMAQTTQAITEKILGVEHTHGRNVHVLGGDALALNSGFTSEKQLAFVDPLVLHDTMTAAYAGVAGSGAINELCDRMDNPSEEKHKQRTLSRVIDAVATWKNNAQHTHDFCLERVAKYPGYSRENDLAYISSHMKQFKHMLDGYKNIVQKGIEKFTPISIEEIGKAVFFQGPTSVYSLHHWISSFHQEQMPIESIGEVCGIIQNSGEDVFNHLTDNEFLRDDPKEKQQQRKEEILRYVVTQPWCTNEMLKWLIDGASSIKHFGRHGLDYGIKNHIRNVASASILGEMDAGLANRKIDDKTLVRSIEMGGDAIGNRGNMLRYAEIVGIEKNEAFFVYGPEKEARELFDSLPIECMDSALLYCAQNRHALALLSNIFQRHHFKTYATTPNGETVAHLLMKHTHKKNAEQLEDILIQMLSRGLDPNARDIDGFLAGESPNKLAFLVDHTPMIQAVSRWQQKALNGQTQQVVGPTRRRQL
jgi:hypothetical protein